MKGKLGDKKLYGLINNAGTLIRPDCSKEKMIKTNFYGPKLMSEAFAPLIQNFGRIVNVGAISAPMYVSKCDEETKRFLSSQELTWDELEAFVKENSSKVKGSMPAYSFAKAALHKYVEISARENPNLKISVVSPGMTATNLTKGMKT